MLYLKNTLGGLSRSLTDSALNTFQGPHRWWKLALFAVLFVLPGGSVGVAVLAWVEHRRGQKGVKTAKVELVGGVRAYGERRCCSYRRGKTRRPRRRLPGAWRCAVPGRRR